MVNRMRNPHISRAKGRQHSLFTFYSPPATALNGKPFYITSSRYRSMVTDYVTPMDKT